MQSLWDAIARKILECDARFAVVAIVAAVLIGWIVKNLLARSSALKRCRAVMTANAMLQRDAELMTLVAQTSELVTRDLVYLATNRTDNPWRTWAHVWHTLVSMTGRVMLRTEDHRTRVILFARRRPEGDLVPTISHNVSAQGEERLSLSALDSLAGNSFMLGTLQYCENAAKDPRYVKHPQTRCRYLSVACAPAIQDGQAAAVLSVDAKPAKAFSDLDLKHLEALAGLAGHIALAGSDLFGWNVIDLIGPEGAHQAASTKEGQTSDGRGNKPSRKGPPAQRATGRGIAGRDHDGPVRD
jgi:hypothetical protein